MRSRAWRRYKNYTKAKRKWIIDKHALGYSWNDAEGLHHWMWYDNLHQYSKNKIHCSCPMCSAKTRNKGKRRKNKPCAPVINYTMAVLRKQARMTESEKEYIEENP